MNRPDIEKIAERAAAATAGPWVAELGTSGRMEVRLPEAIRAGSASIAAVHKQSYGDYSPYSYNFPADANAAFIAHARADIPALLAYIRDLEETVSKPPAAAPNVNADNETTN